MTTATQLYDEMVEIRSNGASRAWKRHAFERWFRQAALEGHPPDELQRYVKDEAKRFAALVVPGADGHEFWIGGESFRTNEGVTRRPVRYVWIRAHGEIGKFDRPMPTCGEEHCIALRHLELVNARKRWVPFSDAHMIGLARQHARIYGESPTTKSWEARRYRPSYGVVISRFGSWVAFMDAAGLEVKPRYNPAWITPDDVPHLVEGMRALRDHLGYRPGQVEWEANCAWLRERGYRTSKKTIIKWVGNGSWKVAWNRVEDGWDGRV